MPREVKKAKRGRPPKGPKLTNVSTVVAVVEKKEVAPIAKAPVRLDETIISNLVIKGDLAGLSSEQRVEYYKRFCEHLGLNPVTQPFSIIRVQGREILYATKMATDQLRTLRGVSITSLTGDIVGDCYRVTAVGHDKGGRTDAATGVVTIGNLKGDALANATMKAETKAKRRLTLSLCGLGMLDESEIETIPGAETVVKLIEPKEKKPQKVDPVPVAAPVVEKQVEVPPVKDELTTARSELQAVYHDMGLSGKYTKEEMNEFKRLAVEARDDLESLVDLTASWGMELAERRGIE
jgi:hypothetical protein